MNRVGLLQKIAFTAGILLATALTFSCSDDGSSSDEPSSSSLAGTDDNHNNSSSSNAISGSSSSSGSNGGDNNSSGGSGESLTYNFAIKWINEADGTFRYTKTSEYYECKEGGVLEKGIETDDEIAAYEIKDDVLAFWLDDYDRDHEEYRDDSLHFRGSSNTIIGTWTRNRNKATSCEPRVNEDKDHEYLSCKNGYDIVKMEISQSTFKITQDFCPTDEIVVGEKLGRNWAVSSVISCDTYELSKGAEKITVKLIGMHGGQVTYNGKTCKDDPSVANREKACRDAWNEIKDEGLSEQILEYALWDTYYEFLENDFFECVVRNNFPPDLFESDYDDGYGEPVGLMKKSSDKPALMKKNLFGLPRR